MVDIEALFFASRGKPVQYEGQTIQMVDEFSVPRDALLRVVRESVRPGWRQGIHLSTDGQFEVAGQVIPKAVVLWADTAPAALNLEVHSSNGICYVKNVWDTGDGTLQSWHNGAAMIVEQTAVGRRYRCNDGKPNADFDDIVFQLELGGQGGR